MEREWEQEDSRVAVNGAKLLRAQIPLLIVLGTAIACLSVYSSISSQLLGCPVLLRFTRDTSGAPQFALTHFGLKYST